MTKTKRPRPKRSALEPPHPGSVLRDHISRCGLTLREFSIAATMSYATAYNLVEERTGMSAMSALKLSKLTGTTVDFWLNLQRDYDLYHANLTVDLDKIIPLPEENIRATSSEQKTGKNRKKSS